MQVWQPESVWSVSSKIKRGTFQLDLTQGLFRATSAAYLGYFLFIVHPACFVGQSTTEICPCTPNLVRKYLVYDLYQDYLGLNYKYCIKVSKDKVGPRRSPTNFLPYSFHACLAGFCQLCHWQNPAKHSWKGQGRKFVVDRLNATLSFTYLGLQKLIQ